jgi:hypothetical protein
MLALLFLLSLLSLLPLLPLLLLRMLPTQPTLQTLQALLPPRRRSHQDESLPWHGQLLRGQTTHPTLPPRTML